MFYHKFIKIDYLVKELDSLKLSEREKHHLSQLVDSSLHHAILDEVLSNLSEEDKRKFFHMLMNNEHHDKILDFLGQKVENIEKKIQKIADDLVKEMHKEVKEAKRGAKG